MSYVVRESQPGDATYVADLHRRLYSEEYEWGPAFIAYAEKIALDFELRPKNDKEALWIVEEEPQGQRVGSIMLCATDDPEVGQLRLLAVEKAHRRHGLGRKLVNVLLEKARALGYKKIILWTAAPLDSAIRQYERFGFKVVELSENNTWRTDGGKITEIKMELDFSMVS